jgi:hypothetical protein
MFEKGCVTFHSLGIADAGDPCQQPIQVSLGSISARVPGGVETPVGKQFS